MSKKPGRRMAVRLSRVDRERLEKSEESQRYARIHGDAIVGCACTELENLKVRNSSNDGKGDTQSKTKVQHQQRLRSRRQRPSLSADDRRLLEDVPPHWTGGNQ